VTGGGVISRDEPLTFTVSVSDEAKYPNIEYLWAVSQGEIIEGQGTKTIKVKRTGSNGENITATVEVNGLPDNCEKTNSETAPTNCFPSRPRLFDEFAILRNSEINARIEEMYLELGNESVSQGFIINYGTDREIALRERQIQKAIAFLKYDSSRVTIVRGGENPNGAGVWTRIWIVPPGAENPQP
jgi:hypothetical protein